MHNSPALISPALIAADAELAAEEKRSPAAKRLARIRDAISGGLNLTDRNERADETGLADAQAAANAERDYDDLKDAGEKQRRKDTDALAKRKAKAEKDVAENMPAFDREAADQAVADAKAAIARLRDVRADYVRQIQRARETLLDGGYELHTAFDTPGHSGRAELHPHR